MQQGGNSSTTEIQGLGLTLQVSRNEEIIATRRAAAEYLTGRFAENDAIIPQDVNNPDVQPTYHLYLLQIDPAKAGGDIQMLKEKLPKAADNFFQAFWHEMQRFFQSFFRNYDRMGATVDASEVAGANEVWLAYGRDQTQVIRNLINNEFTPTTGITIDLKLVAGGTLLPSILSGQGPDVYIGLGDNDVINFAIRGAILPIENNKDFADTALYYKVDENFNTVYDENGQPVRNPNAQFTMQQCSFLVLQTQTM